MTKRGREEAATAVKVRKAGVNKVDEVEMTARADKTAVTCVVCFDHFRPGRGVCCQEGHFLCGSSAAEGQRDGCLSGRGVLTACLPPTKS
jgi:hypothetical protein